MRAPSCPVSSGIGGHGHVETAVVLGGVIAQQQFIWILQPKHVESYGRNEAATCVFTVVNLPHHSERHAGRDGAWNGGQGDVAGHLHGDVDHGEVAESTSVASGKSSGEVVLNHDADVVVARSNTGWRERQGGIAIAVGRGGSEAQVGVAEVPDVVHARTGDVGTIGNIGDF